jgi:hypothetical protein
VINRTAAFLIVAFWLMMTGLLIRLEVSPDKSGVLAMPPEHVFKLMFTHEQLSELRIMDRGLPIGNLRLIPKSNPATAEHTLDFTGNLLVHLPDNPKKQRISWTGTLTMDRAFATQRFHLTLTLRDPGYHLLLDLDPTARQANYEIKQGDSVIKKSVISLDEKAASALLHDELGFDPGLLQNIGGNIGKPALTAKQTELKVRKEKIVAYLLTLQQGETPVVETYVSQLGQILLVKTIFGYTLSAEDMMP